MKSLHGLGLWLSRKWAACQERKQQAVEILNEKQVPENVLREEWAAQVKEQTKPLVRQSRDLANKIIQEILTLKSSHDLHQAEIRRYEGMLESGVYEEGLDVIDVTLYLEELTKKDISVEQAIKQKKKSLDVDGRLSLHNLLDDKFLQLRMNALALKNRIRIRLRQRKFELEGLERAYRHSQNGALQANIN
jgi:hypothetical protein